MRRDDVPIAGCGVSWDELEGDGGRRHCAQCSRWVHSLSGLDESDAQELVERGRAGTERICVMYETDRAGQVLLRHGPRLGASALLLGLGAAAMASGQGVPETPARSWDEMECPADERTEVWVLRDAADRGNSTLSAELLERRWVPTNEAPCDALPLDEIVGTSLVERVEPGQPLRRSHVRKWERSRGLGVVMRRGLRPITIDVEDLPDVPLGCQVDVLGVEPDGGVVLLAANVDLVATSLPRSRSPRVRRSGPTVTVALTPALSQSLTSSAQGLVVRVEIARRPSEPESLDKD